MQNVRDFTQTKLDNGINSPFLLNEQGDPRFFSKVLAKNSLMKNVFEEEKKSNFAGFSGTNSRKKRPISREIRGNFRG